MVDGQRRGVTRGYVWGMIFALAIIAVALIVATWGLLSLATDVPPVVTANRPTWLPLLVVIITLCLLIWGLWQQSLLLLRGRRRPPWEHTLLLGAGSYLIWCVGGLIGGLTISETWLSLYALSLALTWALISLLHWMVLTRRLYTNKPTPRWPWEKKDPLGPDIERLGEATGEDE